MDQTSILIRPVITEKSMDEAGRSRFSFIVGKNANKGEIKKAVEEQFKVNVISVQTLIAKGKRGKVARRRTKITFSPVKKAIVGLKEGQRIELFEVQTEEKAREKKEEKRE